MRSAWRSAWTELRMTELTLLLIAMLMVQGMGVWALVQIVMHGHLEARWVTTLAASMVVQGLLASRIMRWWEKTQGKLPKSG